MSIKPISKLDKKILHVLNKNGRKSLRTVAKEVDMAALFYGFNGLLSKLVHPTAFSIMLEMDHARELQLRQSKQLRRPPRD